MPSTTIKSIGNGLQVPIFVMNVENPADTPNGGDAGQRIDPGQTIFCSMSVPWSGSNQEFPNHHIAVYNQDGSETYAVIWQRSVGGGDAVR